MLVRIYWHKPSLSAFPGIHVLALLLASLLAPSAVLAFTITLWTLAVDLRWTSVSLGLGGSFSRWQFWLASSAALMALAWLLDRYSRAAASGGLNLSLDC